MKPYLLSVYQPEGNPPPPEVLEKIMRSLRRSGGGCPRD